MHTIRPMTAQDMPNLARWIVQVPLWQRYRLTEQGIAQALEQGQAKGHILLVADSDDLKGSGVACGFVWCIPDGAFGRSAYLRLIGVHPRYAGGGLGAGLLAAAEREASQRATAMFLLVSDFNADAQRFYLRHGYQQVGAIPGYVLPDVVELLFWKRLIGP